MTSLSMTALRFDLNEAAKRVDMLLTLLASLSCTRTKYKMATTFGLAYENSLRIYDTWRCHNLGKKVVGS